MAILKIETIKKLCADGYRHQIGSIKKIELTDLDNLTLAGSPATSANVFVINYRREAASYGEKDKKTEAGTAVEKKVTAFIPRRRASVEQMRIQLRDKRIACRVTDVNGETSLMYYARLECDFDTGEKYSDDAGYSITIKCTNDGRAYLPFLSPATLLLEEGTTGGSDFGGTPVNITPPAPTPVQDCCITIISTPIALLPTPTGNTSNKNKVFTSSIDGSKWFIDKNGNAIKLSHATNFDQWAGNGTITTLPFTNIIGTQISASQSEILVVRNGIVMLYQATPTDVNDYGFSSTGITLASGWPLDTDEVVRCYHISTPNFII